MNRSRSLFFRNTNRRQRFDAMDGLLAIGIGMIELLALIL
jgi:hypothetical protein